MPVQQKALAGQQQKLHSRIQPPLCLNVYPFRPWLLVYSANKNFKFSLTYANVKYGSYVVFQLLVVPVLLLLSRCSVSKLCIIIDCYNHMILFGFGRHAGRRNGLWLANRYAGIDTCNPQKIATHLYEIVVYQGSYHDAVSCAYCSLASW